jgi:hypothetical protein
MLGRRPELVTHRGRRTFHAIETAASDSSDRTEEAA